MPRTLWEYEDLARVHLTFSGTLLESLATTEDLARLPADEHPAKLLEALCVRVMKDGQAPGALGERVSGLYDRALTALDGEVGRLLDGLDERGLLIPAERDYLLDRLLESAQARQRGDDPQAFLRDNPHAFTPRDDRMALFHARLSADLGRPPSRFYGHALAYFHGSRGWDQWEFVGYQGIADVACRHDAEPLDAAIERLPAQPLIALCHCLESQQIGDSLEVALRARLTRTLQEDPAFRVKVLPAFRPDKATAVEDPVVYNHYVAME